MNPFSNRANARTLGSLAATAVALLIAFFLTSPGALLAQTAGEGTITGNVKDATGAVIPGATITATNVATNVATSRTSTSSGDYTIAPLPPGTYNLQVTAPGFKTLSQQNLTVNALGSVGFNAVLELGATTETVEVTAAPPPLETTNATVGLVMENETYSSLPIQMNGAQRDATAFASLAPGAQGGTRVPIIGGTGNYLGQLYLDGLPAETINQQGDNRLVSQAVDLDAVDQFQVVTSTPPAEYSGAGALNFTMKSGGQKYHGSVADFVRNTAFDAWSFASKAALVTTASGAKVPAPKPVEHQNELSLTFGGHVPKTANKVFFFVAYDKYHSRSGVNPSTYTVPTALMKQGDFTEINGGVGTGGLTGTGSNNPAVIFDPTSTTCSSSSSCTRQPFQAMKNGVLTNNIIPASYISPISQAMQSFMPDPTNPAVLTNNYLGGFPSGFDNHATDWRVDFDLSPRQRLSTIGAMGVVNYLNNYASTGQLPLPYTQGTMAKISPKVYQIEDVYTISNSLVNQLKYGFTRFVQPQTGATDGMQQYFPSKLGISNTPLGIASTEFPTVTWGTTGAKNQQLQNWADTAGGRYTQTVSPSTYAVLDNLEWNKGKHSLTFGFTYEWEQINSAAPSGFSGPLSLPFNSNSTAQFNGNSLSTSSGLSYASFLLGAVGGTPSIGLQPVSEVGGRYHVASPYLMDNWKVTSKLTIDAGLRWDYFPPFHEVKDRWTFLNPSLTNAATGTPGELQFAGNYGGAGVSCNCRTPVQSYWANWGPRIGLAYAVDDKTVFRGGVARVFSQAGGVGGRGGNAGGTGQTGFNVTATAAPESTTGATAGPSFYLNNGAYFTSKGLANTDFLGKGYQYPTAPSPSVASQILNTGNYLNSAGKLVTAGGVSFADPYLSGRAPEFTFWNFGLERSVTKDMTIAVNYVGDQSHFLSPSGSNARGYWANQLNPIYLAALGPATDTTGKIPLLDALATSANVARAQAAMPGVNIPSFYQQAANANPNSSTLTIAQGLVAFPQYASSSGNPNGVTDLWGNNSANLTYHSFQVVLQQRMAHGFSFNVNYTYSKNIGDDGTFRSGFDIPAAAISGGGQNWQQDRIERSWSTVSAPENLHAYGVYRLPFGRGQLGGDSWAVRNLAGGWQLSGIYTYGSGTPMTVTNTLCNTTGGNANYPLQGQCMTDTVAGATDARIHGSYGSGPNGFNSCNIGLVSGCIPVKYVDQTKFTQPTNVSTVPGKPIYLIGNTARTGALNLRNPGNQNFDASIRRSFSLPHDFGTFVFQVDCVNVWNKVKFGNPNTAWTATIVNDNITGYTGSFGQISSASGNPRDFQFSGHFNF